MAVTPHRSYPLVAADEYIDTDWVTKLQALANAVDTDMHSLLSNARLTDIVATGITTAMFATNVVDTDTALTANSNSRIASQAAVKAYAISLFAANDALLYKGAIDASSNPNYPAADAGHMYRISVAGKIGGAAGVNVEIGDTITCFVDSTSAGNQATVGANWNIVQANLDGAVIGPASSTSGRIATFSGTTGKLIQDSGYTLDQSLAQASTVRFAGVGIGGAASYPLDVYTGNGRLQFRTVSTTHNWINSANNANNAYFPLHIDGSTVNLNSNSTGLVTVGGSLTVGGQTTHNELVTINRAAVPLQLNNSGGGSQMALLYQGASKRSSFGADGTNALYVFDASDNTRLTVRQDGALIANGTNSGTGGGITINWQVGGAALASMGARSNITGGSYDTTFQLYLGIGSAFTPYTDNSYTLGNGTYRWSVVHAGTGTINTSDMREKTPFVSATDSERAFARDVFKGAGFYQWLDAIAAKGNDARLHFGIGAQNVERIARARGLNPNAMGLFCEDELPPEARKVRGMRTRKSLRPDQLSMLGIATLFHEIDDLRAQVSELRKAA